MKPLSTSVEKPLHAILIKFLAELAPISFRANTPGYIYYLFGAPINLVENQELMTQFYGLTLAVISSDPNDTIPQIKAWLAMNNIPFYQG